MISAKKAREKAFNNIEVHIKKIEPHILDASEEGRTEIIIRDDPYADWAYRGFKGKELEPLKKYLEGLGYRLTTYYVEQQFADFGLRISWAE